jgi:hypothetical protein
MRGGHTDGIVVDVGMPVIHRGVRYNCRHETTAPLRPCCAAALACQLGSNPCMPLGIYFVAVLFRPIVWLAMCRAVPMWLPNVGACMPAPPPAFCRVFLLNRRVLLIRPKLHLANDGNYRQAGAWPAFEPVLGLAA